MTDWQEKYDFSNIDPIYHQESANSLAEILYDDDYKSAIGYMRALMARDEHSARALAVVQAVIMRNPAHYTAWHYRLQILKGAGHDIVPKEAWIFHAAAPEIESDDDSEEEDEKEATNSADIKEKTEDQEEEGETKQPTEVEPVAEEPMPVIENYTWLNDVTLDNPKNYQIWHYRQQLAPSLYTNSPQVIKLYYGLERLLVELVLSEDAKNIHAWSHLIWLVNWIASPFKQETKIDKENLPKASDTHKTAQAQPWFKNEQDELQVRKISLSVESELAFIENLLFLDIYNNSAWSYRHFIISRLLNTNSPHPNDSIASILEKHRLDRGEETQSTNPSGSDADSVAAIIMDREIAYTQYAIHQAPQNESVWNYITSLVKKFYASPDGQGFKLGKQDDQKAIEILKDLVEEYVPMEFQTQGDDAKETGNDGEETDNIVLQSTHAIEVLVDIYKQLGQKKKAIHALKLLEKYLPMRRGYWKYLESNLLQN